MGKILEKIDNLRNKFNENYALGIDCYQLEKPNLKNQVSQPEPNQRLFTIEEVRELLEKQRKICGATYFSKEQNCKNLWANSTVNKRCTRTKI